MTRSAQSEDDRIAAWRAQRAAIAAADKAARLGQAPRPEAAEAPPGAEAQPPAPQAGGQASPPEALPPSASKSTPAASASTEAPRPGASASTPTAQATAASPQATSTPSPAAPAAQSIEVPPQGTGTPSPVAAAAPQSSPAPAAPQSALAPASDAPAPKAPAATPRPAAEDAAPRPAAAKASEAAHTSAPTAPAKPQPAPLRASRDPLGHGTAASPAQAFLDAARAEAQQAAPPAPPRRRGLALILSLLPLAATALYLGVIATPLYEARSVIAITRPGDTGSSVQAGLLGGEKPVNLQDVFRAATYIKSRAAMEALEAETGFVTEVSGPQIDPLRRLRDLPALSITRHGAFSRFVETSVDVQSGLLTLYVRAPGADRATAVSDAVLADAEAQVARLGQVLFDQRRADAARMRDQAEALVRAAQSRLLTLQMEHQDVDPRQRVENIYARIRGLEEEANRTRTEIQKAQIAGVGTNRQTANLEALLAQLETQIRSERERLVAPGGASGRPLNTMLADHENAKLELDLAREAVREAIEAEIAATREAALNRSIFQVVVAPDTDAIPAYPRAFTALLTALIASLGLAALLLPRRRDG